ncbi:MAG: ABC transporter ATP-binding protein [Candidatus Margulisiibacteriota bacterium]
MTVLKIEKLVCGYEPNKPIVKEVSFDVDEGAFLGVVGPNGCGKTTLLKAIAGLLKPMHGSIMLGNHLLTSMDRRELAREIAFVPQLMEPVSGFSVGDLVMLGRTPYFQRFSFETADDYEAVRWAIEELNIDGLTDRSVTELSGGEFQRVAIARALAQEPRLLILDEPISHLDLRYQVNICKLLKKLRTHRSIIATFHDLNVAARFCSHLILMKNGSIIAQGLPNEVVTPENIWKAYRIKVSVKKDTTSHKAKYVVLP